MNTNKRKVLVTGGAGFIGSHLVDALLNLGCEIVVIDNLSTGCLDNLNKSPAVKFIKGDITNVSFIKSLFDSYQFSLIFHHAAIASVTATISNPYIAHLVNHDATILLLEAARKQERIDRFIFASSAAVYGNEPTLPKDESSVIRPLSPYAIDKFASEQYVLAYNKYYSLPTVALRYFNVYGPRQNSNSSYSGVLSILTKCLIDVQNGKNVKFKIFGDGEQTRDFVHVKDVISANLLVADHKDAIGRVFNVASGISVSLNEVIAIYKKVANVDLKVEYCSERVGDIKYSKADITAICSLGYRPSMTINEGLRYYWETVYNCL